jgi:hypothetical protein
VCYSYCICDKSSSEIGNGCEVPARVGSFTSGIYGGQPETRNDFRVEIRMLPLVILRFWLYSKLRVIMGMVVDWVAVRRERGSVRGNQWLL